MGGVARIGLLGGTFDPIHIGHLIMAEEARSGAGLAQVVFLPAGQPPHKPGIPVSLAAHRLRMVELAIAENPAFSLSRLDLDRPGPHYSADTVALFRQQVPADAEIFFIMGADSLEELPTWKDPARLLAQCRILALSRPEHEPNLAGLCGVIPELRGRVDLLPMPLIEVSSSDLRERVRQRRSIRYLVPEAVRGYIEAHHLYVNEVAAVSGGVARGSHR
jgi:nicotinate-nucleotide adenylyltransferase